MSAYEVIARRWRPQEFEALIGQDHVRQTLLNALQRNRLHHALLFTGPRGTGKTSTARILAKALRCPEAQNFVPCGTCSECEDIQSGRSLNVIEIDGASNNGVDAIRELRETVGYMPSSGSYKIYIIDEVHMLSQSAFNALLKTLEEPPGHVVFIFATTEVQKIPNTILSRCQRFDFRKIPIGLVSEHLEKIAASEKVKVSKDAIWMIAKQGGGSMRDAQSLLEQMINFSGDEIQLEDVVHTLGLTDRGSLYQAWKAIAQKNLTDLRDLLKKLSQSHIEPKTFIEDLMETIRNTLLVKIANGDTEALELPDSEIEELKEIGSQMREEDLHWQFDMALKGAQDLVKGSDTRLVLEMILFRMGTAPRLNEMASHHEDKSPSQKSNVSSSESQKTASTTRPSLGAEEEWSSLVEKVKGVNGLIGAQLENCYLKKQEGKKLILAVPSKLQFIYDKVNQPEFKKKLSNYLTTFWGPGHEVEIQLGDLDSAAAPTPKTLSVQKQSQEEAKEKELIENHPLVKSAKGLFKAEVKAIKDMKS